MSQDKQNLISWCQLTVFKNKLLPMTFSFPLFCSNSESPCLAAVFKSNGKSGSGTA